MHHRLPLVSILICTFNAKNFIKKTLDSVIRQTYHQKEILIWDDCSTDNTIDILKEYQKQNKYIQIYTGKEFGKKLGPYAGLNYLLKKSSGEYIAILDHDDLWAKEKLEKQVDFLEKNKEFIGCGTKTLMYYESDKNYFLYYLKEKNNYTIHSSLIFRNGNYNYDESTLYFADAYFQKFNLCNKENKIYNLDEVLTFHLIKDNFNNLTYSWFKLNFKNIKRLFDVHGITIYSFLALFYELTRFFIIKSNIAKIFPIFFKWFDRLPYKMVGEGFKDFKGSEFEKIFQI